MLRRCGDDPARANILKQASMLGGFHSDDYSAMTTLAASPGVKQLILTHTSGRYENEEILAEATKIVAETRVAADLNRVAV
jgi:ribonuclease BN (tRNA processing enzyme)